MCTRAVCVLYCVASVVSSIGATGKIKYEGDLTVQEGDGKRLIISNSGKDKYFETITDKINDDGSISTIYVKESTRKLKDKTKLTRVTEEVLKNETYPSGVKVIRLVETGNIFENDPKKSSVLSYLSEIDPQLESWEPMFSDTRTVKGIDNEQKLMPRTTVSPIPSPQDTNEFKKDPNPVAQARPVDGMNGAYPSQHMPEPGYYPRNPTESNRLSNSAAQNRAPAQPVGGINGAYSSQHMSGHGYYPQNPTEGNRLPNSAAQNRAPAQPVGRMTVANRPRL